MNNPSSSLKAFKRAPALGLSQWENGNLTTNLAEKKDTNGAFFLSVGKNLNLDDLGTIPSNVIVVRTAPQSELLKRAALCITHAGLNTALESLAQGDPMVAIPIGYDQPGVAARISYHGVGKFLGIEDLAVERVQWLIQEVLENSRYREKARWFQKVIAQTRGLDVAVDVIERAFRLPVYPQSFRPNPSKLTADRRIVAHA